MTDLQFNLLVAILAIIWVGFLIAVLLRGSMWHRDQASSSEAHLPRTIRKAASISMLAAALALCGMLGITLLTLLANVIAK